MKSNFPFFDRWVEQVKNLARHKRAEPFMAFISFAESIIFPIPTAVLLVAMVQSSPHKAWRYAFICSIFSVIGGLFGYALGWFAYESLAQPILENLGKMEKVENYKDMANEYGAMAVFAGGLTPFPYKVITILSGALKLSLPVFIIASLVSRFAQFYIIAGLVWKFGEQAETIIKKHLALFTTGFVVLVCALWALWKYTHPH